MPGSRWNENAPSVCGLLIKSEFFLINSHLHPAISCLDAQELIGLGMGFKTYVATYGDRHQRHRRYRPLQATKR